MVSCFMYRNRRTHLTLVYSLQKRKLHMVTPGTTVLKVRQYGCWVRTYFFLMGFVFTLQIAVLDSREAKVFGLEAEGAGNFQSHCTENVGYLFIKP